MLCRCGVVRQFGGWCEERRQGRLELGLRVGLALLGVEEARAVDQAGLAGTEQVGAVVAEVEPRATQGQMLAACAQDQLLQIAGSGAGRRRETGQDGDEAERRPDEIGCRAQAMT
jgi:hypothetical protein